MADIGCPDTTEILKTWSESVEIGKGMSWEHRIPKKDGGRCLFVQLEQKKSAGAAHGALQLPAERVRHSRVSLLSKVDSERTRGNSHRLQKRHLLLGIRKKFCYDSGSHT